MWGDTTVSRVLAVCVILFFLFPICVPVRGDGMAFQPRYETYSSIFIQPRQLAYIDVNENGTETIDMFVSLISLDPGVHIKYLVPLPVLPAIESINITNDTLFTANLNDARMILNDYAQKEHAFFDVISDTATFTALSEMTTPIGTLMGYIIIREPLMGMMGGVGGTYYELYGEGYSVSVLQFNTSQNLRDFLNQMNITVSPENQKIVERYADDYFVLIDAETMPPVEENAFARFIEKCPMTFVKIREFVHTHPQVTLPAGSSYSLVYTLSTDIYNTFMSETNHSPSQDLVDTLGEILSVIYGTGRSYKGLEIRLNAALGDGKIYYPLGTSPFWYGNPNISLMLRLPENYKLKNLNVDMQYVKMGGKHCYLFETKNKPDYDLEGTVETGYNLDERNFELHYTMYNNPWIFVILIMLGYASLWYIPYLWLAKKNGIKPGSKILFYALPLLIGFASILYFLVGIYLTKKALAYVRGIDTLKKYSYIQERWVRGALLSRNVRITARDTGAFMVPVLVSWSVMMCTIFLGRTTTLWFSSVCSIILIGGILFFLFLPVIWLLRMWYVNIYSDADVLWLLPEHPTVHKRTTVKGVQNPKSCIEKIRKVMESAGYRTVHFGPWGYLLCADMQAMVAIIAEKNGEATDVSVFIQQPILEQVRSDIFMLLGKLDSVIDLIGRIK